MLAMRRYVLTTLIASALFVPTVLIAQTTNYVPLADYSGTPIGSVYGAGGQQTLPQYVRTLFAIALSAGAILAVIRLVWAGYKYMGTDMWSQKGEAKAIIKDVVFGMLLLLGTYLILYQINPCILNLDILQSFGSGGQACSYAQNGAF
ncbi:hypothetical protein C4568_04695 [Candidatus Parcubacteria bacterium]|nr:MAG: hypothetical protein C4568_04695 [Candidatus Parcubacteria bacterium]